MLGIEQYRKMQEYKKLGISKLKVSEILDLSYKTVENWWDRDEDYFFAFEKEHEFILDNYRGYIVDAIKLYPAINNTVLLRKIKEEFKDFKIPPSTFFRYVKKVREQTGYIKPPRLYKVREVTEPGYEAQVDFGQYVLKSMYGNNIRIYFFCMTFSFSRMKFAYFSVDPFTAKTVIAAHEHAFKYFGGRPQMIMYDQDKTMTVTENIGSPIFVKEFEDYVKETGYSIYLCRGYDPETKGKIEKTVDFIKRNFLDGRMYYGIDRLNCECLSWLDRDGNGLVNANTKKTPRTLFEKEYTTLQKVYDRRKDEPVVVTIKYDAFEYNDNFYKVPVPLVSDGDRVRVEKIDSIIVVYKALTNEVVCKHNLASGVGNIVLLPEEYTPKLTVEDELLWIYKNNSTAKLFIKEMRNQKPRFVYDQCSRLKRMMKYYSEEEINKGMEYCLEKNICTMMELSSFLLYKHGEAKARKYIHSHVFKAYKKTADRIREEING